MLGMEHKAFPEQEKENPTLVATAPVCKVHVCAQQPAVFGEQKAVVAHVLLSTGAMFFDSLQFAPEPATAGISSRGPPQLRPATPISLHTTLRV